MGVFYTMMAMSVELLFLVCSLDNVSGEDRSAGHWGSWGSLSPCSVTCGLGVLSMERIWIPGPNEPQTLEPYTSTQVFPCTNDIYPDCPEDGVWSGWMVWSKCTKACGVGFRERQRQCDGQLYGGKLCEGESFNKEECNRQPCPPLPKHVDMSQCKEGSNFTCVSRKMCVSLHQKCDTIVQCHDGSDEDDCLAISLMRGGNVRYVLSMWGNGAVSSFSSSVVYTALKAIVITMFLFHWLG